MTYLGERFSLLIGPACAQRKVDAIRKAKKSFVFVDPTEPAPKVSLAYHREQHCTTGRAVDEAQGQQKQD